MERERENKATNEGEEKEEREEDEADGGRGNEENEEGDYEATLGAKGRAWAPEAAGNRRTHGVVMLQLGVKQPGVSHRFARQDHPARHAPNGVPVPVAPNESRPHPRQTQSQSNVTRVRLASPSCHPVPPSSSRPPPYGSTEPCQASFHTHRRTPARRVSSYYPHTPPTEPPRPSGDGLATVMRNFRSDPIPAQ